MAEQGTRRQRSRQSSPSMTATGMRRLGSWRGWPWLLMLGMLTSLGVLYHQSIDREVVGVIRDDGAYLASAVALASGEGFRQPNLFGAPWQATYPIGYPLLLALVWQLQPTFPDNLPLLSALTWLGTLGGLAVFWVVAWRRYGLPWGWALAWVALVGLNPRTLMFGTSLLSEGPYLLMSGLALWAALAAGPRLAGWRGGACLLASVLAFHLRVVGATLILGIALAAWLNRQRRPALRYLAWCGLLTVLPWGLWQAWAQAQPFASLAGQAESQYLSLVSDLWQDPAYPGLVLASVGAVMEKTTSALLPWLFNLERLLPLGAMARWPQALQHAWPGLLSALGTGIFGFGLWRLLRRWRAESPAADGGLWSPVALSVALYLGLLGVWGHPAHVPRLLLPVLPWLGLYALKALGADRPRIGWRSGVFSTGLLTAALLAGLSIPAGYQWVMGLRQTHNMDRHPYLGVWAEYQALYGFVKTRLPQGIPIGGERNASLYFYTGHPVYPVVAIGRRVHPEQFQPAALAELWGELTRHRVRYLLTEPLPILGDPPRMAINPLAEALRQQYPERFEAVYHSPKGYLRLYRLKG